MSNCHTCEFDAPASYGSCTLCKNSKYLHDGVCYTECPAGTSPAGSGSFGRACLSTTTAATTSTGGAGTAEPGNFDECQGKLLFTAQTSCRCNSNCHTCEWNGADNGCSICKNQRYLLEGRCVDACPSGYKGAGTGAFSRECIPESPEALEELCIGRTTSTTLVGCTCAATDADCHTCSWNGSSGTCVRCKNEQYLHEGICVPTCPAGFTGSGTGSFNRVCAVDGRRRRSIPAALAAP